VLTSVPRTKAAALTVWDVGPTARRLFAGVVGGALLSLGEALAIRVRSETWDDDFAKWREGWTRSGLPGDPSTLHSLAVAAALGAGYGLTYAAVRPVLPRKTAVSGVSFGAAVNLSLWATGALIDLRLGRPPELSTRHAKSLLSYMAHGCAMGWFVD
jgi:hypothetical protein